MVVNIKLNPFLSGNLAMETCLLPSWVQSASWLWDTEINWAWTLEFQQGKVDLGSRECQRAETFPCSTRHPE